MKNGGDLGRLPVMLYHHHDHVTHDYCHNGDFKFIARYHIVQQAGKTFLWSIYTKNKHKNHSILEELWASGNVVVRWYAVCYSSINNSVCTCSTDLFALMGNNIGKHKCKNIAKHKCRRRKNTPCC